MVLSKTAVLNMLLFICFNRLLHRAIGQTNCSGRSERFINDTCYTYYTESVTWQVSKSRCEARGKVLASIYSNTHIREIASGQGIGSQAWIGASDIATEGTFVWVYNNKTAVELTGTWDPGEPNDFGRNEDCVVINFKFTTNDAPCDFNYTYFCMETNKKDGITTTELTTSTTTRTTTTFTVTTETTTELTSTTTKTASTTASTTVAASEATTASNTVKTTAEAEDPLLSQQNIYIISAVVSVFVLMVVAISCIIVWKKKGKLMQLKTRPHVYDSFPHERHDTVAYNSGVYAKFTLETKSSPTTPEENQYDYIKGETPTEHDQRFYVNVAATASDTFH